MGFLFYRFNTPCRTNSPPQHLLHMPITYATKAMSLTTHSFPFLWSVVTEDDLQYYLVCNETCYANPFSEFEMDANEALDKIMVQQSVIREFADNSSLTSVQVCVKGGGRRVKWRGEEGVGGGGGEVERGGGKTGERRKNLPLLVQMALGAVVGDVDNAAMAITDISSLTDCTILNTEYLEVLENFCTDG